MDRVERTRPSLVPLGCMKSKNRILETSVSTFFTALRLGGSWGYGYGPGIGFRALLEWTAEGGCPYMDRADEGRKSQSPHPVAKCATRMGHPDGFL